MSLLHLLSARVLPVTAFLAIAGCAAAPLAGTLSNSGTSSTGSTASAAAPAVQEVPPPSALDSVSKSTRIDMISPAALLDGSGRVESDIVQAQCEFHTADPPFVVPNDTMGWAINGRLDPDRQMTVLEYRALFGLGPRKQQLNGWPVNLVALSDFPKEYLQDRLKMVADAKLPASEQSSLANQYIANADRIQEAVHRLESSYNPQVECIR